MKAAGRAFGFGRQPDLRHRRDLRVRHAVDLLAPHHTRRVGARDVVDAQVGGIMRSDFT